MSFQLLQNYSSRAKIKILTRQVNVRTLDGESELRAVHYPTMYILTTE